MCFCHCWSYSMCNESAHLLLHSMERPFFVVSDHSKWHESNFCPFFSCFFVYKFNKWMSLVTYWSILNTSNVAILTRQWLILSLCVFLWMSRESEQMLANYYLRLSRSKLRAYHIQFYSTNSIIIPFQPIHSLLEFYSGWIKAVCSCCLY